MSYKETLFFIARCLTISHEEKNCTLIKEKIVSGNVDWDTVVSVSTEHLVFPALYCNLKRTKLLQFLSKDLADYMAHIASLNKTRNEDIIRQAKEIDLLLKQHSIYPVFLKGTAFLLQDFYEDISERMIGDIDFIVSANEYEKTVEILKQHGYNNKPDKLVSAKLGKHYPRMTHGNQIAAIEVHFRIIKDPYDNFFNYKTILPGLTKTTQDIAVLGLSDQVLHTIFNNQTNDLGYWYKNISLRNCYDLFLLSKKTNTLQAIQPVKRYFHLLNTFLASSSFVFNGVSSIQFKDDSKTRAYIKSQMKLLGSSKKMKAHKKKWDIYFNSKTRLKKLQLAFVNKDVRSHLIDLLLKR